MLNIRYSRLLFINNCYHLVNVISLSLSQKDRKTERKKERKKDRKTERQKDRKTERLKDKKTERQKDGFLIMYINLYKLQVITL